MSKAIHRPGDTVETIRIRAFNRLAAATAVGTVGQMNDDFANATYALTDYSATDFRRNIVAQTTEGIVSCRLVVAEQIMAVGQEGWWILQGDDVYMRCVTGLAKGDYLIGTNADDALTFTADTVAALEAIAVPTKIVGRAYAANATGADAIILGRFNGHGMFGSTGYGA